MFLTSAKGRESCQTKKTKRKSTKARMKMGLAKTITVEGQFQPSQGQTQFPTPAKRPEARPLMEASGRYLILNWKGFEETWPLWKKAFFWCAYRPFYQFSKHVLKMPVFSAQDEHGRVCWIDFQGWVTERWQAIQVCESKGWTWGYMLLPESNLLPDATLPTNTDHNYPLTDLKTQEKYEQNGNGTIPVGRLDLVKLASKLAATDALVERHQSRVT